MPIANRVQELNLFQQIVTREIPQRILLIEAASGFGKTHLLAHFACNCPQTICCIPVDLKSAQLGIPEFLYHVTRILGSDNFPQLETKKIFLYQGNVEVNRNVMIGSNQQIQVILNVDEDARRWRMIALTEAFFDDLRAINQPITILIDTFNAASKELAEWLECIFLSEVVNIPNLSVVIAGQQVPQPGIGWMNHYQHRCLGPITDIQAWQHFVQDQGLSCDICDLREVIEALTIVYEGLPNEIRKGLETLARSKKTMNDEFLTQFLSQVAASTTLEERAWIATEILLKSLEPELQQACWAMTIPHWFDEEILAHLCPKLTANASKIYKELQTLPFIETFPERGYNIHEATRKLMLNRLWQDDRKKFIELSTLAKNYFANSQDPIKEIEWLYHLSVLDEEKTADTIISSFSAQLNKTFRYCEIDALVQVLLEQVEADRVTVSTKAIIYYLKGNTETRVAQDIQALESYQTTLRYREIGDRVKSNRETRVDQHIEEALESYQTALRFYREIGDRVGEANTLKAIGDILHILKRSKQALEFYIQAWELLELYCETDNCFARANILKAINHILQSTNNPNELLPEYSKNSFVPPKQTQAPLVSTKFLPESSKAYINHQKYGLLYRICMVDENKDLFATLYYAQDLFFLVTVKDTDIKFQIIDPSEARMLLKNHLLTLRGNRQSQEYEQLYNIFQRTFSE